jgi:hypothetical protein
MHIDSRSSAASKIQSGMREQRNNCGHQSIHSVAFHAISRGILLASD